MCYCCTSIFFMTYLPWLVFEEIKNKFHFFLNIKIAEISLGETGMQGFRRQFEGRYWFELDLIPNEFDFSNTICLLHFSIMRVLNVKFENFQLQCRALQKGNVLLHLQYHQGLINKSWIMSMLFLFFSSLTFVQFWSQYPKIQFSYLQRFTGYRGFARANGSPT